MHTLTKISVIAALVALCAQPGISKPDDAVPVTSGTPEGNNVQAAAEFLRSMGYEDKADNILQFLRDGKIFWSPSQAENGDTDGDKNITISAVIIRTKSMPSSKPEQFDPNTDRGFADVLGLARTLFHEKIHAHQSNWYIGGSNFKAIFHHGTPHEFDAWSETIEAMDHWINTLYEQYLHARYIEGKSKAEYLAILKRMDRAVDAKSTYLNDFILSDCQGYDEYLDQYKDLAKDVDKWKKWVKREFIGLVPPPTEEILPEEPPGTAKEPPPDPKQIIKSENAIEKNLRDTAPESVPPGAGSVIMVDPSGLRWEADRAADGTLTHVRSLDPQPEKNGHVWSPSLKNFVIPVNLPLGEEPTPPGTPPPAKAASPTPAETEIPAPPVERVPAASSEPSPKASTTIPTKSTAPQAVPGAEQASNMETSTSAVTKTETTPSNSVAPSKATNSSKAKTAAKTPSSSAPAASKSGTTKSKADTATPTKPSTSETKKQDAVEETPAPVPAVPGG
jgi:hypothetical protein